MKQTHWMITGIDTIGVVVFFWLLAVLFADLFAIQQLIHIHPWLIGVCAVAGYVLADGLSGFVHFLGDSFGSVTTPILGSAFIFPFREHHVDPKAITRHSFIETNGHNCLVSLPVMIILHAIVFPIALASFVWALGFFTLVFAIIGVFFTNQFHKWAHAHRPPRGVAFLQRMRIILSPAHHEIHHTPPFTRYYCITTGWLNNILEKLHFFPIAKACIRRIPFMLKPAEAYKKTPR